MNRGRAVTLGLLAAMVIGCRTDESEPVAPVPSVASSKTVVPTIRDPFAPIVRHRAEGTKPGVDVGPVEEASPETREAAALALLSGAGPAGKLPVVAVENGARLDPSLRNQLAPRQPAPGLQLVAAHSDNALPEEVVQRIARSFLPRFRSCYRTANVHDPEFKDKIILSLVLSDDGHVDSVSTEGSSWKDAKGVACVKTIASRIGFPKPASVPARVTLSFEGVASK